MARYRVNRKEETVDKQCLETGSFKPYKKFSELTKRELKKANEYWIYNLK